MGLTYPPPAFVFFFFLFSFRLSDISLLGAIAGEASKNSKNLQVYGEKASSFWQIFSGIKKLMFAYYEKKPNVLYHGIWAVIASLLNNVLLFAEHRCQELGYRE